jgi:hypothetical protein
VGDVGPVEAIPLHHERLGPDALLGRGHHDANAQHLLLGRVLEPLLVHHRDAVPRAEDDVDEAGRRADLRQPMGEDQVGLVPGLGRCAQESLDVAGADEDVEILGRAVDACLMHERERAPDQERNAGA